METQASTDDDALYLALKTRDARFDGRFFTGVTSTGIYCRPVCKVRTPKRENCRFFPVAAQAERAGFRPCLRCRPELAPDGGTRAVWSTQDASGMLAQDAARLLDASVQSGQATLDAPALAGRLGISERHLRRIFEAHWGVTPLQYVQTRRLLAAKQYLTDTDFSVTQIAQLSGFASLRRFNAAFVAHYRLQPRALRKAGAEAAGAGFTTAAKGSSNASSISSSIASSSASPKARAKATTRTTRQVLETASGLQLRASFRPPYDVSAMLEFLGKRALPGVESVDLEQRSYARTLALDTPTGRCVGWVHCAFAAPESTEPYRVSLQISESLSPALPAVLARLRALLDLDADPLAINTSLGDHFSGMEGLRVPGTVDGFELAVRAILGQQVTVAAGRTFAQRLVQRYGQDVQTPWLGLNRVFPHASVLAAADAPALGELGIVRQRQGAILALARACAGGELDLGPSADLPTTLRQLQELPGVGPWTAHYIAMRALRWPDAFPSGDVAVLHALGLGKGAAALQAAERIADSWRPWRSYGVVRAWHSLAQGK